MRLHRTLPLALLLPLPALGQGIRAGFQVGVLKPIGGSDFNTATPTVNGNAWVDGKAGLTVGGHASWELNGGHMLRLRLDASRQSGSASPALATAAGASFNTQIDTLSLMGDYIFHLSGKAQDFFVTLGAGVDQTRLRVTTRGFDSDDSKAALAVAAGCGWRFNQLMAAELRYISSHPTVDDADLGKFDFNNDRFTLGLSFSF